MTRPVFFLFAVCAVLLAGLPVRAADYCTIARRCAYITIDAASGTVIDQRDPDKRVYPASLTKLMTAYMLFDALEKGTVHLSDRVIVSSHAASMPALKLGLHPGQFITIEDALEAITVRSANDAAVIVAEAVAGSESAFAARMTRRAREIGMNRTVFRNASGLPDPDQVTTARDMAQLAQRMISDHPRYRRYFTLTEAYVAGRQIEGHNNLLKAGTVDGGKTGYIRDSGYNLVAWSERGGRLLIGSIFGGRTAAARDQRLAALLNRAAAQPARILTAGATTPSVLPRAKPETVGDIIAASTPSGLAEAAAVVVPSVERPAGELDVTSLPPASAATFTSSWAIQIGAYRDEAQAQQALQAATRKLPTVLGAAYPRTVATDTTVGQLYRAQIIGLDERQARTACSVLSRQGLQCLTVSPGGQPS